MSDIDLPTDWKEPDWHEPRKCHEWKNYVSIEVEDAWESFNDKQKQILACNFQHLANREEWEQWIK